MSRKIVDFHAFSDKTEKQNLLLSLGLGNAFLSLEKTKKNMFE